MVTNTTDDNATAKQIKSPDANLVTVSQNEVTNVSLEEAEKYFNQRSAARTKLYRQSGRRQMLKRIRNRLMKKLMMTMMRVTMILRGPMSYHNYVIYCNITFYI